MYELIGRRLPDIELASTGGNEFNPAKLAGLGVFFCYPYTGRPDHPDPQGWDSIPGAHGSTPQALAYSKIYEEFKNQHVRIFGLSCQEPEWQEEFATRFNLPFLLISDSKRLFSNALGLPTFKAGKDGFLRRQTIIARNGVILAIRYPIPVPVDDAVETLDLLRSLQ